MAEFDEHLYQPSANGEFLLELKERAFDIENIATIRIELTGSSIGLDFFEIAKISNWIHSFLWYLSYKYTFWFNDKVHTSHCAKLNRNEKKTQASPYSTETVFSSVHSKVAKTLK